MLLSMYLPGFEHHKGGVLSSPSFAKIHGTNSLRKHVNNFLINKLIEKYLAFFYYYFLKIILLLKFGLI